MHEMMNNTIGVGTTDSGKPRRSTCTPEILPCKVQKVKKREGSYDRKAKNPKKSYRNIKNSDVPTLKLETNELEVFVNSPWDYFCAVYFF